MCYNKLSDSYTLHQSQFFVPENEMDKSINGNWYLTKKGGFCLLHFSGSMSIDFTFVTCKISFFSVAFHRIQNLGGNGGVKD